MNVSLLLFYFFINSLQFLIMLSVFSILLKLVLLLLHELVGLIFDISVVKLEIIWVIIIILLQRFTRILNLDFTIVIQVIISLNSLSIEPLLFAEHVIPVD